MTTQGQQPPFFLVARNAAAADSFRYVLEHEGYAVSGFSTDFNDALGQICTRQPAVVVVGSELPEITGLDFVRTVQREHSSMRSILFAREAEPEYAKIALDEGVAGLLSPDSFVKDILECTQAGAPGSSLRS